MTKARATTAHEHRVKTTRTHTERKATESGRYADGIATDTERCACGAVRTTTHDSGGRTSAGWIGGTPDSEQAARTAKINASGAEGK